VTSRGPLRAHPAARRLRWTRPVTWATATRGWQGWLAPAEYPRVVNPPSGRIVTANNRIVGGEALRAIAREPSTRARVRGDPRRPCRDRAGGHQPTCCASNSTTGPCFSNGGATSPSVCSTPPPTAADPARREFRDLVERGWNGRASADLSRLPAGEGVPHARGGVAFAPLIAPVPGCRRQVPRHRLGRAHEGALWQLVRPPARAPLDPKYARWEAAVPRGATRPLDATRADARWRSGRGAR